MALAATAMIGAAKAAAIAPGCTATQPTFVGGTIRGYPDGRALDVALGVEITDSSHHMLWPDGSLGYAGDDYSWKEFLNTTVAATGTESSSASYRWGRCVTAKASRFYVEMYPKNTAGVTDNSRYGSASYYNGVLTPGANVEVALRLPLIHQLGGNTGGIQGYISYSGKSVPTSAVTTVVAFTYSPGNACGIEGFSAAATVLGNGTSPDRTYYKVDYLAGGQCGAPYQAYYLKLRCHLMCGAVNNLWAQTVHVVNGHWPRVDVIFAPAHSLPLPVPRAAVGAPAAQLRGRIGFGAAVTDGMRDAAGALAGRPA